MLSEKDVTFRCLINLESAYVPSDFYFVRSEHINVFKAVDIYSRFPVVIKSVSKSIDQSVRLVNEVIILKRLNFPNLIKLRDHFQTADNYYIVYTDDNAQSLLDYFYEKREPAKMGQMKDLFYQLVKALKYLHNENIGHSKIDFTSLFYSKNRYISIGGFSYAIDLSILKIKPGSLINNMSKQPISFQPPEVLDGKFGLKSDIWSLGVVFYSLIAADLPFKGSNKEECNHEIRNSPLKVDQLKSIRVDGDLILLLEAMLCKDISLRPSADELLKFNFFKNHLSEMSKNTYQKSFEALHNFAQRSKFIQSMRLNFVSRALNKNEAMNHINLFNIVDTDEDGRISLDEFVRFKRKSELPVNENDLKKTFMKLDHDNNGFLEYEEFIAAFHSLTGDKTKQKIRVLFHDIDKNKDGIVSFEEMQNYLGTSPEGEAEMAKLKKLFGDNNGITYKQFEQFIMNFDDSYFV